MTKQMCSRSENKDELGEEIAMTMTTFLELIKKQGFIKGQTLGELASFESYFPFLI